MLKITDLSTSYGKIRAVRGIDIDVAEGEIVTLIGANGAGKTTTLMTLSGVLKPTTGQIEFRGERIDGLAPHQVVAKGIVQVPEGRRILPQLTVEENLDLGGFLLPGTEREAIMTSVYEQFPRLHERRSQLGGTLSGGEQQMLAIGRALMAKPQLLLLDEPSLGLAPIIVERIFSIIHSLNCEGVTVLLVEQNATLALELAHRAYVMETGYIKATGKARELREDPMVRKAYLGL
jgi:branched-chain amino acid transport system ATP-binding protein